MDQVFKDIENLQDNWNGNGAKAFSTTLIDRCKQIVSNLNVKPAIFPTAKNSIQLEYEKDNGEYLEFEVFEDKVEVFIINSRQNTKEYEITDSNASDRMHQIVNDFFK